MTSDEFKQLKSWFYTYTKSFVAGAEDPAPYLLKQVHTERVCDNMDMLSDSLELDKQTRFIARATALVHDIGRFSQFKVFGTFSDVLSKNHAALGAAVLSGQKTLCNLPSAERRLILRAVALHNMPALPLSLSPTLQQLVRMLRDADKIDIYRVMTELYLKTSNDRQTYITHNLPDDKIIPPDLVDQIISEKCINYNQISTLNGIKLFQISMIFDLNFSAAFNAIKKQGVVRAILSSMPESSRLDDLERVMTNYIDNRVSVKSCSDRL